MVSFNSTRHSPSGLIGSVRMVLGGAGAAVLGAAPHVLHHAGPLAGAALLAGVGGKLIFGALGLVAAVPTLVKMRRRTGNWYLPGAALALFATMFAISSFVIGPALTGNSEPSQKTGDTRPKLAPTPLVPQGEHVEHHE